MCKFLNLLLFYFFATSCFSNNVKKEITFENAKTIYSQFNEEVQVQHTPIPFYVRGVKLPRMSLNGDWLFSVSPKEGFEHTLQDKKDWKSLPVPSEWNMNGFEVKKDMWAGYYKEFCLPADWYGKNVIVRFGTVQSECKIYLNGYFVGTHVGSMTAFEKDITKYISKGLNKLALYVRSDSDSELSANISHYAKHQVGGILRPVELIVCPHSYIKSMKCDALLDSTLKEGTVNINLELNHKYNRNYEYKIRLSERGIEGLPCNENLILEKKSKTENTQIVVLSPKLWHAETPFIYNLDIELYYKGQKIETIRKHIGFRKIEIRNNSLYVNNRQVKLHGVARHDVHPYNGRAVVDTTSLINDIRLLREGNCNFIRTSHYPADEFFMDLCDRYGMFVEDEAPVCWDKSSNTITDSKRIFYAFKSLLYRDRSHPSVITWSIANESRWNPRFVPCYLLAKELTPHIPVKFSHTEYLGIVRTTDIGAKHYPGWRGLFENYNYFRPIIYSEALHLNCYNTSENITDPGLRDLWGDYVSFFVNNMQESPSVAGLAIWGGIDEMFYPLNSMPCGYGPWGVLDGFRRKKPEYWHMKMAYSPIVVQSKHFIGNEKNTSVVIENRYNQSNMTNVEFHWSDKVNKGVVHINIEPGKQGILTIPSYIKDDTLNLVAVDKRGFNIASWSLPRNYSSHYVLPTLSNGKKVQLQEDKISYRIKSNNLVYVFSKKNGYLKDVLRDGERVFVGSMHGYLVPLQKENETINFVPVDGDKGTAKFVTDSMKNWIMDDMFVEKTDYGFNITVRGSYDKVTVEYIYKIDGNNRLRVDYTYNINKLSKQQQLLRQYGVGFDLPGTFTNLKWKRKGIWTTYPKDHIGRNEGVARAFYPATLVNYLSKREIPKHSYSEDGNKYGSNDFRSTKHNIINASLFTDEGRSITVESNGCQHIRSWVNGDKISFIVAPYSNGGNEFYLSFDSERTRSLNYAIYQGDITGWMQLRF